MTKSDLMASSAQTQAAAGWVARLGGEPGEADWLEFEGWLNAAPANRAAYDRVLAVSLSVERQAEAITDMLDGLDMPAVRHSPAFGGRAWMASGLMAVAAVAVTFAVMNPQRDLGHTDSYVTAKGEHRDVTLSDGTKVALNTNSAISVTMKRGSRQITLASGEAAFQVTHDANRPFVVHVGDRVLEDLGTDFDVTRQNGQIAVTVREGLVAVHRVSDDQASLKLSGGMRLDHQEGAANSTVSVADTETAFAWRSGRLIYRDRPLAEIAADLNRYGDNRVQVSGPAASLRFSGVLTIDNQSAMVDRLTALLPVTSRRRDGVITLSELNNAR